MLICHCKRVSDRHVRLAIAGGARTRRDVTKVCGAGTGANCGGCRPLLDSVIKQEVEQLILCLRSSDEADAAE